VLLLVLPVVRSGLAALVLHVLPMMRSGLAARLLPLALLAPLLLLLALVHSGLPVLELQVVVLSGLVAPVLRILPVA
jgi:hypothetical protein